MSKAKAGSEKERPGRRRRPGAAPKVAKTAARKLDSKMIADNVEQVSSLLRMAGDPGMASILIALAREKPSTEALSQSVRQDRAEVEHRLATLTQAGLIGRRGEDDRSLQALTAKGRGVARSLEELIYWEDQPEQASPEIDPALLESLGEILEDPEGWFLEPNTAFGGRRPLDLLGTPEEPRLRNQIEAARQGMFS